MSVKKVNFDTLRTLAFGDISGTYAAVGTALGNNPRIICITNATDAAMIFSDDVTNAVGKLYLPANSFKLFDFTANINPGNDDNFVMANMTIMYVKQLTAPTTGAVYIEYVYGT